MLSTKELGFLNLSFDPQPARGRYVTSGTTRTLGPREDVRVSQTRVRVETVQQAVLEISRSDHGPSGVIVTPEGDGVRHLDGLHRLVAARILNWPVEADVWVWQ